MNLTIEICCGSAEDVLEAARAGATRVELNSDLFHGGLTPSIGSLHTARALAPDMNIQAMVRPREGGFCYTDTEYQVMLSDAYALLRAGADGIVFGFLLPDGRVDRARCEKMLEVIREAPGEKAAVFHRAIDVTPDWRAALSLLMELGVTRVLTSGQASSVLLATDTICAMREQAAGRIEILPGGGINARNLQTLVDATGCTQLHMSGARRVCYDTSTQANEELTFGGALYPPEDRFRVVDSVKLRALLAALEQS